MPVKIIENLVESIAQESQTPLTSFSQEDDYLERNQKRAFLQEDLKTRQEANILLTQNRQQRKTYASKIFTLTCVWTALIFLILIMNGLKNINGKIYFSFVLSDSVLITLITSTTINFFTFFLLVVRYLFHTGTENEKAKLTDVENELANK